MLRVFFVDDRPDEIVRLWERSGCATEHQLCQLEPFISTERTLTLVLVYNPDVVLVGFGLGKPGVTGVDVIRILRNGGYAGHVIANSGGGVQSFVRAGVEIIHSADRNPDDLRKAIENLRNLL